MRGHAKLGLMRFGNDRTIQIRRQLFVFLVAVIDPDFDDIDFLRGVVLNL